MKIKKFLVGAFLGMFAFAGVAALPVSADTGFQWWWFWAQDTQYNVKVAGHKGMAKDGLIKTIKTAINRILGMLSLVALGLCLRWGFQMMTSGWDSKKYESGINLLKWAWIWLAVIACSWLIVSLIFYVIQWSTDWANQVISAEG